MALKSRPPQPEQSGPYLPPGPEALSFEQFTTINTSTSRPGVRDEEMWWCDGFFPIGPRMLRTLPGAGDRLYSITDTYPVGVIITLIWFGNIHSVPYCIAVANNGAIVAINQITNVAAVIAPPGTLSSPSATNVGISQYSNVYFLFVDTIVNGYFIWDGTTFYKPGDSFGGGTVPTAIGGNAIEVYAGRVWIANGATIEFSAPGSIIDFTTLSGGGAFTASDSFLRVSYIGLKQSNGFLYMIADSSVNYISNVQTSGSPLVTTFTNQNADPEVGSPWAWSIGTWGRNIILANSFGIHISYGAAVTKISEPLDGVYGTVPDLGGGFFPSAAKGIVFGKKIFMLLLPIIDPISGQQRTKLLIWNGQKTWFSSEQDVSLTFIGTQEINSVLTAWGTDSISIWPLFQQPSAAFEKVVQSKLWDRPVGIETLKSVGRLYGAAQFFDYTETEIEVSIDNEQGQGSSASTYTVVPRNGVMTWTGAGGAPLSWTGAGGATLIWLSTPQSIAPFAPQAVAQNGIFIGFTVRTNGSDLALIMLKMQPEITGARL